jgi:5'/3'-nucleotidase SurE
MESVKKMHVLLTNDDGHAAPGIQTMRSALRSRGYRVSMVAPSEEQSATGMSTTTRRNLILQELEQGAWHLDAQPADAVMVALRHLLEEDPPDLVLSGVNFGPNLGTGLHASGTVGAAIAGLLHGLPAIAVSAGMLFQEARENPPLFPSTHGVLEPAANFTCSVIESLRASGGPGETLLPRGIMLNINYPPLPEDAIKGVIYPEVSAGHMIELRYRRCDETGHLIPGYRAGVDAERPQEQEGDVRAHLEGYITISPIKPSWTPSAPETEAVISRLSGLDSRR